MKNTDPPNGKSHKLKLTPELHRFIQRMGGYFESSGVPPIGGLILGLLMLAHEPLSAEDIASSLKVSRASVSTNFRVLLATGLIEKHTDRADRHHLLCVPRYRAGAGHAVKHPEEPCPSSALSMKAWLPCLRRMSPASASWMPMNMPEWC